MNETIEALEASPGLQDEAECHVRNIFGDHIGDVGYLASSACNILLIGSVAGAC
jgi:hypothetical protein